MKIARRYYHTHRFTQSSADSGRITIHVDCKKGMPNVLVYNQDNQLVPPTVNLTGQRYIPMTVVAKLGFVWLSKTSCGINWIAQEIRLQ